MRYFPDFLYFKGIKGERKSSFQPFDEERKVKKKEAAIECMQSQQKDYFDEASKRRFFSSSVKEA